MPHSSDFLSRAFRYFHFLYGCTAVATAFALPLSTTAVNILFLLCPVLFFLSGNLVEKWRCIWQCRAIIMLIILFGWMVLSVSYTEASLSEASKTLLKYDKLLLGVFFLPIFTEEKWRRYALYAFFVAIVVMFLGAVLKEMGFITHGEKFGRFLVFKDRIQTSFLMAMAAYFAGIYFFAHLETYKKQKTKTNYFLWVYGLLFLSSVIFLFSVNGRSGYIIFFALFTWLLWTHWRWKGIAIAIPAIVLILGSAYLFSQGFNQRLQESAQDVVVYQEGQNNTSLGLRAEFAKHSLVLIKAHPLLGTGTGSFNEQYADLKLPKHLQTHNPHNQYLHMLVQWGIVGLALLLVTFYVQWQSSSLLSPTMRQIAQGTILAIALGSFANSWLLDTTEGHFYVYFLALAFGAQQHTPFFKRVLNIFLRNKV